MFQIKYILKYSFFILAVTVFSLFTSLSWIENIGFIFVLPSATIIPLFSLAYGLCVGPLYAILFFQIARFAPKRPFLTGLAILLLSMLILIIMLGSSLLDILFTVIIFIAATSAALLLKKRKEK